MLVVETIAKIHRAYFKLGKRIKEICRELRVSRKVVRKVIRSDATEFGYERSRVCLDSSGVDDGGGEMDHSGEALIGLVGSQRDSFELLELAEEVSIR